MGLILKCKEISEKMRHYIEHWISIRGGRVRRKITSLEILHEVVEHTKTFRVLTVLNIDKGPDFCGLHRAYERCLANY